MALLICRADPSRDARLDGAGFVHDHYRARGVISDWIFSFGRSTSSSILGMNGSISRARAVLANMDST